MKRKYKAVIRVDLLTHYDILRLGPEYFEDHPSFESMWGSGEDSITTGYRWACVEVEYDDEES